jgi:hypothetical protein
LKKAFLRPIHLTGIAQVCGQQLPPFVQKMKIIWKGPGRSWAAGLLQNFFIMLYSI